MNKDNVINIEFFRDDSIKITFSDSKNYTYDRGYLNSPKGRLQLQQECDEDTIKKVFERWGDNPTEEDFVLPDLPIIEPQPTAEQLAILDLTEQTVDNDYRISVLELGL